MKRLIFSLALPLLFVSAYSQGEMDALKYSQSDIMGTARYMSMGGAFGALGADASAIIDNPAGLGVYRKSELSLTTNLSINNTETTSSSNTVNDARWNFNLNNFAFVLSYLTGKEKGLVASNFGITYNRLKNFHSDKDLNTNYASTSILDYAASNSSSNNLYDLMNNVAVLDNGNPFNMEFPDNKMSITEKGSIGEWDFTYGANLSNFVYLGIGLGVRSIDYRMSTYYHEDYYVKIDGTDYPDGSLDLYNSLNTTGMGANLKLGAIIRPVDFLRVSFAFQTPTFYDLQDDYSASANSSIYSVADSSFHNYADNGYDFSGVTDYYGLNTPLKINTGLAFVIGTKGIISGEYEMADYSQTNFSNATSFNDNQNIKSDFQISHTFKFGAEYRISDMFSIRGGYAFSTNPVKSSVETDPNAIIYTPGTTTNYSILKNNTYYTGGFGYKEGNFFMDFAYLLNVKNENLYPYYSSDASKVKSNTSNIVCTFGWRY